MKDKTQKVIETIAERIEDMSGGLDTVYEMVALVHTETGETSPDTDGSDCGSELVRR